MPRQFLEDAPCNLVASLSRLIGIGRGADGDIFAGFHFPQLLAQQVSGMFFNEDLALEIDAVAHLHELVRVPRVAVFARKLASSIRVNRPLERKFPFADAPIQDRAGRQREVFDVVPLTQGLALSRQPRDADEPRPRIVLGKKRESCHDNIRLLFAILGSARI